MEAWFDPGTCAGTLEIIGWGRTRQMRNPKTHAGGHPDVVTYLIPIPRGAGARRSDEVAEGFWPAHPPEMMQGPLGRHHSYCVLPYLCMLRRTWDGHTRDYRIIQVEDSLVSLRHSTYARATVYAAVDTKHYVGLAGTLVVGRTYHHHEGGWASGMYLASRLTTSLEKRKPLPDEVWLGALRLRSKFVRERSAKLDEDWDRVVAPLPVRAGDEEGMSDRYTWARERGHEWLWDEKRYEEVWRREVARGLLARQA